MTQPSNTIPFRVGLLLAAAALPLSPLAAQDDQPQPAPEASAPPTIDAPPAPPAPDDAPADTGTASDDAQEDEAPAAEAEAPPASTAGSRAGRARSQTAPASPANAAERPEAASPVESLSTAPPAGAEVPLTEAPTATGPAAALPPPVVMPPKIIQERNPARTALLWSLAGLILFGGLALLFARRRRRESIHEEARQVAPAEEAPVQSLAPPVAAATAQPAISTLIRRVDPAPVAPTGVSAVTTARPLSGGAAPGPAAPGSSAPQRSSLALKLRPTRAGIRGSDAVVQFQLSLENCGAAPVRDVRVATWLYPQGAAAPTEAERMLIEHPVGSALPQIEPGGSRRIESSARLAVASIKTDSLLPVIVAECRYISAEGRQERASVAYAVGVPVDGELAHFDLANPTGLHDGVEARPVDERASANA